MDFCCFYFPLFCIHWLMGDILLLWLIGVVCGWKWTYSLSTWGWNWVRETFGEKALRICVGALLVIALAGVACLYFATI